MDITIDHDRNSRYLDPNGEYEVLIPGTNVQRWSHAQLQALQAEITVARMSRDGGFISKRAAERAALNNKFKHQDGDFDAPPEQEESSE